MRPTDSNNTRSIAVRAACQPRRVTLCTRDFGRGVDFVVYSSALISAGGMHVIQTFLSIEYCEEVQIKGRTCRQDNPGSYSLILAVEHVENYIDVGDADLFQPGTDGTITDRSVYSRLHQARVDTFDGIYHDKVTNSKGKLLTNHLKSLRFINALERQNLEDVSAFLTEQNRTEQGSTIRSSDQAILGVSRTAILLDATKSMTCMLFNTKSTIVSLLETIHSILLEKGIRTDFQVKFYVYRNYGCGPELVVEESCWEYTPEQQKKFLDDIVVQGGQKREAIEAALQLVNEDIEKRHYGVTQILLIGDAGPNDDTPSLKRQGRNEIENSRIWYRKDNSFLPDNLWEVSRFPTPTTFAHEFDKICRYEIPVHTFFVEPVTDKALGDPMLDTYRRQFHSFAEQSHGTHHVLQNRSNEQESRNFVLRISETILKDISKDRGQELFDAFRSTVESSHSR
jgi:hypothetical protein